MTAVWVEFKDSISHSWSLKAEGGKTLGPHIWINYRKAKYMGWAQVGEKIHSFSTLEEAQANLIARWRLLP